MVAPPHRTAAAPCRAIQRCPNSAPLCTTSSPARKSRPPCSSYRSCAAAPAHRPRGVGLRARLPRRSHGRFQVPGGLYTEERALGAVHGRLREAQRWPHQARLPRRP